MIMGADVYSCKVCFAAALEEVPEFRTLPRVTSDCVVFRPGGRLLICRHCGAAQSPADAQWFEEIGEIYSDYRAYHQSGGVEQHVFDPTNGALRLRSEVLLDHFAALPGVPSSGKVLDVGCGRGGTLRAFSRRSGWRLYGLEMDDKSLPFLKDIEGFETLYTCLPADVSSTFDLVTMVHSLEHFPEPIPTLRDLRRKIVPDGRLLVEVPDAGVNAFDFVIADHMLHFTTVSLRTLCQRAGFTVDFLATDWITKELSLIAKPAAVEGAEPDLSIATEEGQRVRSRIGWLCRLVTAAETAAAGPARFGLFGTSIAATWLCGVLGHKVSFFIEEDPSRIGRPYMDRPVLSPEQAPPASSVFLALVPQVAVRIAERLENTGVNLCMPPA